MKHLSFHEKNRCKNRQKNGKKSYTAFGKCQSRRNTAFWGRFTNGNYAKESSHLGEKCLQDKGDEL